MKTLKDCHLTDHDTSRHYLDLARIRYEAKLTLGSGRCAPPLNVKFKFCRSLQLGASSVSHGLGFFMDASAGLFINNPVYYMYNECWI